ncbi:Cellular tumor antigen p53 [Trichinella pseudospiralis]|uniref:Cellular tumor antigen p53 n=1 Tax=Trichinella pseudospiralis TaxID=6337 RepID=A0A0V1HD04_TRIPS|nr:Cellular tumor antigen p53 [Trichinella pseudospiralis]KRZ08036.1 Cellular tumor antigen p53 [Trichinella pseudospiralis]KRZ37522.1 Cellular tumor antigen p53 [Trichinella pseudospiralis]
MSHSDLSTPITSLSQETWAHLYNAIGLDDSYLMMEDLEQLTPGVDDVPQVETEYMNLEPLNPETMATSNNIFDNTILVDDPSVEEIVDSDQLYAFTNEDNMPDALDFDPAIYLTDVEPIDVTSFAAIAESATATVVKDATTNATEVKVAELPNVGVVATAPMAMAPVATAPVAAAPVALATPVAAAPVALATPVATTLPQGVKTDITDELALLNTSYSGPYGFRIYLTNSNTSRKSIPYLYSAELNKIYTKINTAFPVKLRLHNFEHGLPANAIVRFMAVYARAQYTFEPVLRCMNHQSTDNSPVACHFVRCHQLKAIYMKDEKNHYSVYVKWSDLVEQSNEEVVCAISFCCFNSCSTLCRRAIQLSVTLEESDHVLARQLVGVKVCACPNRDKNLDALQYEKMREADQDEEVMICPKCSHTMKRKISTISSTSNSRAVNIRPNNSKSMNNNNNNNASALDTFIQPKRICVEPENEIYLFRVQGRQLAKMLSKIVAVFYAARRTADGQGGSKDQATGPVDSRFTQKFFTEFDGSASIETWLKEMRLTKVSARKFYEKDFRTLNDIENFTLEDFKKLNIGQMEATTMHSWLIQWRAFEQAAQMSSLETPSSFSATEPPPPSSYCPQLFADRKRTNYDDDDD